VSERQRRVAENEAIFREVNERIESLSHDLRGTGRTLQIVCECGDTGCIERIAVPAGRYEDVRGHPARFLLVTGHEQLEVEQVVSVFGAYEIVEKTAPAGREVAAATDPRG
jgi:hypothetical protein